MEKNALLLTKSDNVATALEAISNGDIVIISDSFGRKTEEIRAHHDIPRGHKIALKDIEVNDNIVKYGYSIGTATKIITKGDYVHTHNLGSSRGRGDL